MDIMLKVQLIAQDLVLGAATDLSKQPFTALITYAGKPSDGYVGGTEGIRGGPYRVRIPVELMEKKIKSLAGKRVFASSSLDTHKESKFVGQFVDAWIEKHVQLESVVAAKASGYLLRSADPDLVAEIVERSRKGELGFSYDLKDVRFELAAEGVDGSESQCIDLTDFQWRGATILKRETAAYLETELAAQKSNSIPKQQGEDDMTKEEMLAAVAAGMETSFAKFVANTIDPLRTELTNSVNAVKTEVAELRGKHDSLAAQVAGKPAQAKEGKTATEGATSTAQPTTTKIPMNDLMASLSQSIIAGMTEVVKPLQETVDQLKEATAARTQNPTEGFRKTLSAQDIAALTKYGNLEASEEPTVENYQQSIAMIQADNHLSKEAKGRIIADLRAQKNFLIRAGVGRN